jgi:hypothetical protein
MNLTLTHEQASVLQAALNVLIADDILLDQVQALLDQQECSHTDTPEDNLAGILNLICEG